MINVTRSSMPNYNEYIEEIKDLWDSHWLTNQGVKHQKLQKLLEEKLKCPHITLYTNGHLALEGMLDAFEFPKGSEIITTPFTFVSTTNSIVRCGMVPVFCDVNEDDYCIDVTKIEQLITSKTVAIMAVHVYGNMCAVEEIERIAKKHNLKVFYDAAHAFGVEYKGVSSANFGDASMYSFHATKVFNTIEGGAVCYKDDDLITILNDWKNFGIHNVEECKYVGGNAKMNEFQAAMGICNLRHLDDEIYKRSLVYKRYIERLGNIEGIKLVKSQENVKANYAYFPVVFENFKYDRNQIFCLLAEHGITARKYFYPLTNEFECFKNLKTADVSKTPIAKYLSDRVLCLPMYADLSIEDVDKICDVILK